VPPTPPSFDLVVATIGRERELARLLDSLESQTHRAFRTIVVDQNDDDRVARVLAGRDLDLVHLRAAPGLARARNAALPELAADLVTFPDDDCVYAPEVLELAAARFAREPSLDGLSARTADALGNSDAGWGRSPVLLTRANVWNLVASAGIVLRRELIEGVGRFDERLGVGSPEPWSSGEETDYVIRALDAGARIEYDPTIVVGHELATRTGAALRAQGFREGASVGYLLRKHRYPPRTLARMAIRPVGGAALSLARLDPERAGFHAATLAGRTRGYLATRRSNSSP
jgi:glycosyltransferase involved in cell wall biosynthesis